MRTLLTAAVTLRLIPLLLFAVGLAACGEDSRLESPERALPTRHTDALTAPPGWSTTGTTRSRTTHVATLLASGKVLIAGGVLDDFNSYTNTAELYDPATGTWSPTGSMSISRRFAAATRLPDGKVLVAGGNTAGPDYQSLASAELYDPATGTWSPTGSMAVARTWFTMTPLPTGKVLVTGGFTVEGASIRTASAELYDPATGTWSPTGAMAVPRSGHAAVLLPSGKVLVMGASSDAAATTSAELYDPATGSFTPTGGMKQRRESSFPAVMLESGKVLVVGGYNSQSSSSVARSAELYEPATGTWSDVPLPFEASGVLASRIHAGKVLFVGGTLYRSSYVYQPATGTWLEGGVFEAPHNGWPTATRLDSGELLLVGGELSPQPVATQLYTERGPVAKAQSLLIDHDTAVSFTLEATEPDGDAVSFAIVQPPTHGTLTGTPPTFQYVPEAGFSGMEPIYFKASDGLAESPATLVRIDVVGPRTPPKEASCAATGGGPLSAGLWLVLSLLVLSRRRPPAREHLDKA